MSNARTPKGKQRRPLRLRDRHRDERDPIRAALPGRATGSPARGASLKRDRAGPRKKNGTDPAALWRRPWLLFRALGPGLITGASDDDPSGIGTYAQVGSQFGYGLLWTTLFTFPLMVVVQETCARIGLHTGEGLGVALRRRFPMRIVMPMIVALVVANTVNVGADLGAMAAGAHLLIGAVPSFVFVLIAAAAILWFQLFSTLRRLSRVFRWLTLALFAYVITLFVVHPNGLSVITGAVVPHVQLSASWLAALVAILGTTISPYLFFWQASSEADESPARRSRRRVPESAFVSERIDVTTGMAYSQVVMFCIIAASAAALNAHGITQVQTAAQAASALRPLAGQFAELLFALGIIGTGLLAVPVLSASAAYALREALAFGGGLQLRPRSRPTFYSVIVVATVVGVLLNLVGVNPIRALFLTAVLNGLVAPPLLVLITITASDRRVMGRHVSGSAARIIGWIAAGVMSAAALGLLLTLIPW